MRLDINDRSPASVYRCAYATVLVNGAPLKDVLFADEERGEIHCYARDEEGQLVHDPENEEWLLINIYKPGLVQITFDKKYDAELAERLGARSPIFSPVSRETH